MQRFSQIIIVFSLIMTLAACSYDPEVEQEAAIEAASEVFKQEQINEINTESDEIMFYLPRGSKVKSTTKNNLIFEKGSQVYILFFNENENDLSEVVYNMTSAANETYTINETYDDEDKFGFLLADEIDDQFYELTVGIGGIKLTTETALKNLKKDSKMMMEVVKSIKYIE